MNRFTVKFKTGTHLINEVAIIMTDFRQVSDDFYVSPQISVEDVEKAANDGFTAIIVNRPDSEERNQPTAGDIRAKAEALGLAFYEVPISGMPRPDDVSAMANAISAAEGKTLAYCRSGTRSVTLWGFSQAQTNARTTKDIIDGASGAGYDLTRYASTFDSLRAD